MLSFYKHFHLESHIIRYRIGRKFCKPNHRMSNMFSEYWILFKALFVYQYFNFTGKYTLNITVTMNLLRAKEASHHRVTHTNLVQLLVSPEAPLPGKLRWEVTCPVTHLYVRLGLSAEQSRDFHPIHSFHLLGLSVQNHSILPTAAVVLTKQHKS